MTRVYRNCICALLATGVFVVVALVYTYTSVSGIWVVPYGSNNRGVITHRYLSQQDTAINRQINSKEYKIEMTGQQSNNPLQVQNEKQQQQQNLQQIAQKEYTKEIIGQQSNNDQANFQSGRQEEQQNAQQITQVQGNVNVESSNGNYVATKADSFGIRPFRGKVTAFTGEVYTRNDSGWFINKGICKESAGFVKAQLRGPAKTPIYVYSASEDQWVSGNIIRQGMWEGDWVAKLNRYMSDDPEIVFLDIGANVGVFSLTAAKLGRHVIAVDALQSNIARLCKSVSAGELSANIVLIHNALSNKREKVALGTYKRNVGGTYVKKLGISTQPNTIVVDAIYLDDLLELFDFQKYVIKMDVETFEAKVLEGAERFFNSAVIKYMLLEFVSHRGKDSGRFIIDFLHRHQLEPDLPSTMLQDTSKWPGEVLFKRIN